MEALLSKCLANVDTLDRVPGAFTLERVGANPFAAKATLLWDDPQLNPF